MCLFSIDNVVVCAIVIVVDDIIVIVIVNNVDYLHLHLDSCWYWHIDNQDAHNNEDKYTTTPSTSSPTQSIHHN